ncbi:MAG: M64 family metallopeptidase [Acidobacteriota bacterium]|nr:M64 family metallopeptidase [Acidobacteriota bacterium]
MRNLLPTLAVALLGLVAQFVVTQSSAAQLLDAASIANQQNAQPAHYLVVSAGDGLLPRATFYRQVQMAGPFESLGDEQMEMLAEGLTGRQGHGALVRLRDGKGQVVYQTVVKIPRWLRSETLLPEDDPRIKERDTRIDAHVQRLHEATFAVRVPVIEGATDLEIAYGPAELRTANSFDLDDLGRQFFGAEDTMSQALTGATFEAVPGYTSGSSNNRVDILFLAEGYTSSDLRWFRVDTDTFAERFMSTLPFSAYPSHFNFWRLHVPSLGRGADRPLCPDPDDEGLDNGTYVSTAFDATYCTDGIWRLLTVDTAKALQAASGYPDWDIIVTVVQSTLRGGSGGEVAVTSMDDGYTVSDDILGVVQHEFAHTFAGLGDEYVDTEGDFDPCSDLNTDPSDNCEPNVTDVYYRSGLKWKHWVSSSTSVPTVYPLSDALAAGAWEGARYEADDMYRQCFNGIMRDSLEPFCRVDRERILISMYLGGWGVPGGGVSTIEPGSRSPSAGSLTLSQGQSVTLSARTFAPSSGPNLTVEWYVNNAKVRTSSVSPGNTSSYTFTAPLGGTTWTVRMKAIDNNSLLHSATRPQVAKSATWTIQVSGGGCQFCVQGD